MALDIEIEEYLNLFAKELKKGESGFDEIKNELAAKFLTEEEVVEVVGQIKKRHYAKIRKSGITKIIIGALLLMSGFVLTVVNFHANVSFSYIMYCTSIVGVLMLFYGMYEVIG